jgi:hypothetical protein
MGRGGICFSYAVGASVNRQADNDDPLVASPPMTTSNNYPDSGLTSAAWVISS